MENENLTQVENDLRWREELESAIAHIMAERHRQKRKWGVRTYSDGTWLKVMSEELGEVAKEMLNVEFANSLVAPTLENRRKEAIHLAAVSAAYVQHLYFGEA